MKLCDIIKSWEFKKLMSLGDKDDFILSCWNVDDAFYILRTLKINEVDVSLGEMATITKVVTANSGQTEYGSNALKTGKVDEFLGIKLNLI